MEALAAEGLQSKPVESQLLIAEAGTCPGLSQIRAEGCCTVQWSGGTHTFPVVQQIILLGVQLDGKGSTECSVLHALAQGTRAWHAQRSMLVRRSVPLAQRLARFYSRVAPPTLWGKQGWALGPRQAGMVRAFELRCVRGMLGKKRRPEELWLPFLRRTTALARRLLDRHGQRSFVARHLAAVHGWAGHLARNPASPANQILTWRSLSWFRHCQAVNFAVPGTRRHHKPGRFTSWEAQLENRIPCWQTLAQNRAAWQASSAAWRYSVEQHLLGSVPPRDCGPARPPISSDALQPNPELAELRAEADSAEPTLCRPGISLPLAMRKAEGPPRLRGVQSLSISLWGDSKLAVGTCLAQYSTNAPLSILAHELRKAYNALLQTLKGCAIHQHQPEARISWRPRAHNTRADALAARGRDGFPQVQWFAPLATSAPGPCLTLFGAFDGSASPSSPSAGAGWWLAIGEFPHWDFSHQKSACVHEGAAPLTTLGATCNAAEFTGLRNLLVVLNTLVLQLGQCRREQRLRKARQLNRRLPSRPRECGEHSEWARKEK